jgi:hypothetical protein
MKNNFVESVQKIIQKRKRSASTIFYGQWTVKTFKMKGYQTDLTVLPTMKYLNTLLDQVDENIKNLNK